MIAWKTLREYWVLALIYTVILEGLLIPAIGLFPTLHDLFQLPNLLTNLPLPEFMKGWMKGISDSNSGIAYRNFMAIQVFFKGVNMCGIAAAVLMGTALVTRERENQTLEFLLARPVSRSHVLWSKFWVTAMLIIVPIFLTSWSTIPLSTLVEEDLGFAELTLGAFHSSMFVLTILSFTTICSVVFKSQLHTAAAVGSVVIVQAAIYFIQEVRAVSLFRLSDFDIYAPIMLGNNKLGPLFWDYTVWLVLASIVLYAIADRLFQRTNV